MSYNIKTFILKGVKWRNDSYKTTNNNEPRGSYKRDIFSNSVDLRNDLTRPSPVGNGGR